MYRPTRDEIRAAHRQGEEATIQLFEHLARELQALQDQLQALQDQLNKNSKNSSKPPSSDGLKKLRTKSQRKPGKKKNGGQEGHVGRTLEPVEEPDHTVVHTADQCDSLRAHEHSFVSTRGHCIGAIRQPHQGDGSLPEQLPIRPVGTRRRLFRGYFRSSPNGGDYPPGECKMCREHKTSQ